jgi:hypothetical protein
MGEYGNYRAVALISLGVVYRAALCLRGEPPTNFLSLPQRFFNTIHSLLLLILPPGDKLTAVEDKKTI